MTVTDTKDEAALPWTAPALDKDWVEELCTAGMQTSRDDEAGDRQDSVHRGLQFGSLPLMDWGRASGPFPFLPKM